MGGGVGSALVSRLRRRWMVSASFGVLSLRMASLRSKLRSELQHRSSLRHKLRQDVFSNLSKKFLAAVYPESYSSRTRASGKLNSVVPTPKVSIAIVL